MARKWNPTHECPARNCSERVASHLLACRHHWAQLPREIKLRVWRHYVPGQSARSATPAYFSALEDALDFWDDQGEQLSIYDALAGS